MSAAPPLDVTYRALGAAGVMGASSHLVTLGDAAVVMDAGCDPRTGALTDVRPAQAVGARALVVSHAHLDHTGGLPIILRGLPNAFLHGAHGTRAMTDVALRDHLNRCRAQAGAGGLPFSEDERAGLPWKCAHLGERVPLWTDGPFCTLLDAGHLAGSAGVLLEYGGRRVFYTGDTHLADRPWLRGATWPDAPVDVLLTETTQGANPVLDDVLQATLEARLLGVLREVLGGGGQALLPVFAFGKAQEVLALISQAMDAGRLPVAPIFISGLAARVNVVARRNAPDGNPPAWRATRPLTEGLVREPPRGAAIFLSGSGMLAEGSLAGRLAEKLSTEARNALIFVGYLDPESPGFEVRHGGRPMAARMETIPFSAHASRTDLLAAILKLQPRHAVLTHGDESARAWFADRLASLAPTTTVHRPLPGQTLRFADAAAERH